MRRSRRLHDGENPDDWTNRHKSYYAFQHNIMIPPPLKAYKQFREKNEAPF